MGEIIRCIFAVFMAVIIPLSGFFTSLFQGENILNYTEYPKTEKSERNYGEFLPSENDIFVDASAESGNGTRNSPFNNIISAKEKAKEIRNQGINDRITIWISEGTYIFEDTIIFDNEDADSVVYRAMPNEKVEFSGAVSINNWKEDKQNGVRVFTADVPDGINFDAVTKDGTTLPKTRYPETGYLIVEAEDHSDAIWTEENMPWSFCIGDKAFVGNASYNPENLKNVENVIVRVLHKWVSDLHYLKAYDSKTNKYYTVEPFSMTVEKGDRYFFENIFEELNSPGEWYFDKAAGKLYYVPQEDDTVENTVINVCVNDKLILMKGVNNIEFFGITFCNTNFSCPEIVKNNNDWSISWRSDNGIRYPQAEYDTDAAIDITEVSDINFVNCNFRNIGNTAIKFNTLVKNSKVRGCHFKNIGASGVYIHGLNSQIDEEITENISVIDNKIESYGRNWQSAIGVFITHARNCIIQNNEICDGYYTAISVGWIWGYAYSVTKGNIIKDNLIYNIGQGWLSDMGGIYTLGEQTGTVVSGNVIHNVAADPNEGGYGGWGLYFDEGSANIVAENNLIYDCGSQSFHQHYGKDNILRNNIFALSDEGQIRCTRNEEHNEFHLTGNIILTDDTPAYAEIRENKFTDDNNLYWDLQNGKYVYSSLSVNNPSLSDIVYDSLAKQMGFHKNAVYGNPQFRDPENGDFLIADGNSEIEKIGFKPWDYNKAGTLTSFR